MPSLHHRARPRLYPSSQGGVRKSVDLPAVRPKLARLEGAGAGPSAAKERPVIDPKLLEILVCPACKTKVTLQGDRLVCQGPDCGLAYPIRDDIPVMIIDEAEKPGPRPPSQGE